MWYESVGCRSFPGSYTSGLSIEGLCGFWSLGNKEAVGFVRLYLCWLTNRSGTSSSGSTADMTLCCSGAICCGRPRRVPAGSAPTPSEQLKHEPPYITCTLADVGKGNPENLKIGKTHQIQKTSKTSKTHNSYWCNKILMQSKAKPRTVLKFCDIYSFMHEVFSV